MLLRNIARKRRMLLIVLLLAFGIYTLQKGVELSFWRSEQIETYNQGLTAYMGGDAEAAIELFDRSIAAYEAELAQDDWLHRLVFGEPSRELAALANFQKGKALLMMQQTRPAIEALMEAIRLNPGNDYTYLNVATEDVQRLYDQALIVKYDLEMLFQSNRTQAQQSQQGQGDQPAEQGDQPVPGSSQQEGQPGSGQGEGGGDDL